METRPLNDERVSAVPIVNLPTFSTHRCVLHGKNVLRFHSSPRVDKTVSSMPTGSSPQVGPSLSKSILMMCSPCSSNIRHKFLFDEENNSQSQGPIQDCHPLQHRHNHELCEVYAREKGCGRFGQGAQSVHQVKAPHTEKQYVKQISNK